MTHDPNETEFPPLPEQLRLILEEGFSFSGYERNVLSLNLGGKEFLDISGISGIDSITDGRAAVFADFDNDGDLDVFLTTPQGQAHLLFRNNIGQENNWLRIALEGGPAGGRDVFGAVVRVRTSAGTLSKVKDGGQGYMSQHDPRLLFGLGSDDRAEWIEVTWPNGENERFEADAHAGSSLLLRQGSGRAEPQALRRAQLPDPLSKAETFARSLKLAVGRPLPDLAVKTLDGTKTSLRQHQQQVPGRRMLINVWATWCLPCAAEMPELEHLRPLLASRGIDIIGLNVDTVPEEARIKKFIARTGVGYAIYVGGVPAIEQLYATDELTIPVSFLVDEQGVVTEIIPGWSSETQRRLAALAGLGTER